MVHWGLDTSGRHYILSGRASRVRLLILLQVVDNRLQLYFAELLSLVTATADI